MSNFATMAWMKGSYSYRTVLVIGILAAIAVLSATVWFVGPYFSLSQDQEGVLPSSELSPLILGLETLPVPAPEPGHGGLTQVAQPPLQEKELPLSPADVQRANETLRNAMVNIFCIADRDSIVGSVSGSGIIIDPRGTILTNAHVAQRLLLADYPREDSATCVARTGSPAVDTYTVELAYISPKWVFAHRDAITQQKARGTGEDDFALLTVTGSATELPLSLPLPFITIAPREVIESEYVIAAGYPATGSDEDVRDNLNLISAFIPIQNIYTFERNTADLIALGGTQISEQGVSGGGVANTDGDLLGILVTSSLEQNVDDRSVNAITLGHIIRSFRAQHNRSFAEYVSGLHTEENFFNGVEAALTTALLDALDAL